jgi:hypothetical protein
MEHTHTRARSVSPGPPWPTRVCSQPIRDGRRGFAATLALCAQLASGHHVTPAPVPPAAAPGPRRPRPPTGPAAPPPRDSPAGRPPLLGAGRPPGSPPLSREVPAAVPQSPQSLRREAPALARAVTPARPTPTVCRAALSASAAVSRDGPGSPLHRPSGDPREHGCRAILHFPKNRRGGRDLLWRWSVRGLFPIQCGPHFISGRGLSEIPGEPSRGATCRQLIPVLDMEGSQLQRRWALVGD